MTTDATPESASSSPPPTDPHAGTLAILTESLGAEAFAASRFRDNTRVHVSQDRLIDALTLLRDRCGLQLLSELGGVDYLGYPDRSSERSRFEVHYVLRNLDSNEMLIVKVGVDESNPSLPTAVPLWLGADWMEREVFDMYGIHFEGHPDLRRILMPEEFTAFPLRKDYPLRGRGERHNFRKLTREES
jgi:NADH-quinone oxidoreductase subunit C